ncbi:MAG: carboxypeptidase-like regulatory domain-containing protein, partial [Gorillibacterium sp.]|nr:carboxypeptidase-like regulatory domain-containing protein [Gorillibacterium sp.]
LRNTKADQIELAQFKYDRAMIFVSQGEEEQAEQILTELGDSLLKENKYFGDLNGQIVLLQAKILLNRNELKAAYKLVEAEFVRSTEHWNNKKEMSPDMGGRPSILEQLAATKKQLHDSINATGADKLSVYSGTIMRSDGVPLINVGVFLRTAQDSNHSVLDNEPYQVVTDANGRFMITGVLPGSYQLVLGLEYEQISGWAWPIKYNEWI